MRQLYLIEMSKKVFELVGRLGNNLGKVLIRDGVPHTGLTHFFKDLSAANLLKERLAFPQPYLDPHHKQTTVLRTQSQKDHNKPQAKGAEEHQHSDKNIPQRRTQGQEPKEEQAMDEGKPSFFHKQFATLKKQVDWKKHLAELQKKIGEEKKNLVSKASEVIAQQTDRIKEQASAQMSELEEKRGNFFNRMRSSARERRSRSTDYLRQKMEKLQEGNSQDVNQKLRMMEEMVDLYRKRASEFAGSSKDKLAQGSDRVKQSVKSRMEDASNSKIDFFSKMINRIFWKLLLLIAVASFAYGLGASMPHLIRQVINDSRKGQKGEQRKSSGAKQQKVD